MTDGSRLIANRAKHCPIEIFGNPTAIIARFVKIYFQSASPAVGVLYLFRF